jgi:hypothetical protein
VLPVDYYYYYFLWLCSPERDMAYSFTMFHDHTHDAPQSVCILWKSNQLVAEISTWQHTTHTIDKHPCPGGIRTHDRSRPAAVDLCVDRAAIGTGKMKNTGKNKHLSWFLYIYIYIYIYCLYNCLNTCMSNIMAYFLGILQQFRQLRRCEVHY